MKSLHLRRLKQLAEHLKSDNLIHEKFSLSVYNENESKVREYCKRFQIERPNESHYKNGVAQMGNAIGECPAIFNEWHFAHVNNESLGSVYIPCLKDMKPTINEPELKSTLRFFQLTEKEFNLLFLPYSQRSKMIDGWYMLNAGSTPEQQAYNLDKFIQDKSKQLSITI